MAVSPSDRFGCAPSITADVRWVPTRGVGAVPFLVVLVVAVVVVVLVMRAAAASGRASGGGRPARPPPQRPTRPLAPGDDPGVLRELERRTPRGGRPPALPHPPRQAPPPPAGAG